MPAPNSIDLDLIVKIFDYDKETGVLTWKYRDESMFKRAGSANSFNKNKAGTPAGKKRRNENGKEYLVVKFNGANYLVHRICWAIYKKEQPKFIDHINGDSTDNRACNLRSVSITDNNRNMRLSRINKSGFPGVSKYKANKWQASIYINNTQINLGHYDSKAEAVAARKSAEKVCGYHENHGSSR
ncbi:TPA: HNH endonuclease [Morganella morganii]|nr:HNH endonuclease [Morganella morganii]